ncbi:pilus assembly protein [Photobacterium japonica]|uniref:TadE/TadG family type IV pilus assembly protein n=1 Tax=Photobacterium japonica TaxID=2910235 RepID=UPI003D0D22CB
MKGRNVISSFRRQALPVSRRQQRGTTSIEFALGGIVLMLATFAIFEVCYHLYVVNVTESALRETIRGTKIYQGQHSHANYQAKFDAVLRNDDALWHFLVREDQFELSSTYFRTYRDLVNNTGLSSDEVPANYVLAEVTLTYHYTPMMDLFTLGKRDVSRTMLLNLEHEGWDDEK